MFRITHVNTRDQLIIVYEASRHMLHLLPELSVVLINSSRNIRSFFLKSIISHFLVLNLATANLLEISRNSFAILKVNPVAELVNHVLT